MQAVTIQVPPVPGEGLAQSNPDKAIELLQAQIAGVKKEIADLTGQLVAGTTEAREDALQTQIASANERLTSLQSQLDRVVSGNAFPLTAEPPSPPDPNAIPEGVITLTQYSLTAVVLMVLGLPLVKLLVRRLEPRGRGEPPPDVTPRMERLEQAVDAVAIEVERISEGQRYTNKLLGELRALPSPNPMDQWSAAKGRVGEREGSGERR